MTGSTRMGWIDQMILIIDDARSTTESLLVWLSLPDRPRLSRLSMTPAAAAAADPPCSTRNYGQPSSLTMPWRGRSFCSWQAALWTLL
ncbi:MAG TPA: hypothetical protein VNT27_06005, partial [Propionibacteriaceae bacterium]|nr:hypothetical protein [Propionibacteriaceae bacterium]